MGATRQSSRATKTEHPPITRDPAVLAGKPMIRGTRLSVECIVGLLARGWLAYAR
jgi:uncharacterized protein (DUF433 family)